MSQLSIHAYFLVRECEAAGRSSRGGAAGAVPAGLCYVRTLIIAQGLRAPGAMILVRSSAPLAGRSASCCPPHPWLVPDSPPRPDRRV
jgi:hypothetical protein